MEIFISEECYITYKRGETSYLGEVSLEDGSLTEEFVLEGLGGEDMILAAGQGTDSDLLLYGNKSGCFAWYRNENKLENRSTQGEGMLPMNAAVTTRVFLEDGRFLRVENISEGNELTQRVFHYIPAGR